MQVEDNQGGSLVVVVEEATTASFPNLIVENAILPSQRAILRLKAQARHSTPRVHWTSDTVDNELLCKKKSNVCCIFHPNDSNVCKMEESGTNSGESSKSEWNAYELQPKFSKKTSSHYYHFPPPPPSHT